MITAKAQRHLTELAPPVREILQPQAGENKVGNHQLHKAIRALI